MPRHTLEFRRKGNAIGLAEHGDVLEPGVRVLAAIDVSTMQMSKLFGSTDAIRDACLLFALSYRRESDDGPIETRHLHPVVKHLRLIIAGAAMAAAVMGEEE